MARGKSLKTLGLIGVPVGFILVFFIVPLAIMAAVSVAERGQFGGVQWNTFSIDAYVRFFYERDFDDSLIWNPAYAQILLRSVWLSLLTTVLCVLIGFPTALYMAMQPPPRRNLLIFLVTIPFWTNLLVRNYAWILMLRSGGLLDSALQSLGLTTGSLNLMYTETAIAIGLTYSFLPFMVLPIYSSLEKLDFRLVEAAYDLGADKWRALRRIVIPLAMPGIAAGAILVFIPCLGAYVTPDLLGGSKSMMIGNLIQNQFGSGRNWPFGAALSFALLAIVLLAMMLYLIRFRGAPQVAK
ncbi:MAG: ABC transporter permease [Inquilinus limosus]|uniref:ABC transporter permease n=1 Tax=Inquilinus limosus TaxID=171674 RepID=A0A952FII7_9PROT|nr:ABC transporter permease [Inquilinus limosus]